MKSKRRLVRAHYVSIDEHVYNSVAFRTLPGGALKLWIDLRTAYRGFNNGLLMATRSVLARRGWNSNDKLTRATHELLRRGLIRYTRRCGQNVFHRASLFAFTDVPTVSDNKFGISGRAATNEYLHWQPGMSFDPDENKSVKSVHRETVENRTGNGCVTSPIGGAR
jgi:hypothetical protein